MKTDSLFYKIFLDFPEIFFELIGESPSTSSKYRFISQEVKQLSFRLDGLYLLFEDSLSSPFYLVEAQAQPDDTLYYRLFSELFLYLSQYRPLSPWRVVIIYPNRQTERIPYHQFEEMLSLWRVQRFYLNELEVGDPPSLSLGVLKLVSEKESKAVSSAKILIGQARAEIPEPVAQKNLIELIEKIIVYKLPLKSREEIEAMLDLQDFKQTRFYQEAFGEGRQEEGANLVLRLLTRRFGEVSQSLTERVRELSVEQLEELGEALLDFQSLASLVNWLER